MNTSIEKLADLYTMEYINNNLNFTDDNNINSIELNDN